MGIFGKLFGKKEEEFDFKPPTDSDLGLGKNDFGSPDMGFGDTQATQTPGMPNMNQNLPMFEPAEQSQPLPGSHPMQAAQPMHDPNYIISKNIEVISSKLDALQASLESINQRLINIERIAHGEQQQSHKYRW